MSGSRLLNFYLKKKSIAYNLCLIYSAQLCRLGFGIMGWLGSASVTHQSRVSSHPCLVSPTLFPPPLCPVCPLSKGQFHSLCFLVTNPVVLLILNSHSCCTWKLPLCLSPQSSLAAYERLNKKHNYHFIFQFPIPGWMRRVSAHFQHLGEPFLCPLDRENRL